MTRSPGIGFVAGGILTPLVGSYLSSQVDAVDRTVYTFSVIVGAADPLKSIVIVSGGRPTAARQLVSVDIGGTPATIHGQTGVGNLNHSAIASAPFSGSGLQTVTLTFNGSMSRCAIAVYSVIGNFSVVDSDYVTSYISNAINTMNVVVGGFMIASVYASNDVGPFFASPMVTDADDLIETNSFCTGSGVPATTGSFDGSSGGIPAYTTPTYVQISLGPV